MAKKYYNLKNILSKNAQYNVIFGERSNGKTYAVLEYGLKKYVESGEQLAIVRRMSEDFTGKRGAVMFANLVANGIVRRLTNNQWSDIYYYGSRWYLCRYDDKNNRISDETPFAYGFAISGMEHDKSTSYPKITTICFDEFISRTIYLQDEFVLFMNVLSTIIRQRNNVKIFMLGNTINKYCPYFAEMGLKHIRNQKQGTIDVYKYGDSGLTVAVEYAEGVGKKDSDIYFAFDNPKLQMITGGEGGAWEIGLYPHCPIKIRPADIYFVYYIQFNGDTLQCEIVRTDGEDFTFIHPKTTEIKEDSPLIFTPDYHAEPNYIRKITKPRNALERAIAEYYIKDKIFYADNETGEVVRNYLLFCNK